MFAVRLLNCQPLALIPVNGQKSEIGGQLSDRKMAAARAPVVAFGECAVLACAVLENLSVF